MLKNLEHTQSLLPFSEIPATGHCVWNRLFKALHDREALFDKAHSKQMLKLHKVFSKSPL